MTAKPVRKRPFMKNIKQASTQPCFPPGFSNSLSILHAKTSVMIVLATLVVIISAVPNADWPRAIFPGLPASLRRFWRCLPGCPVWPLIFSLTVNGHAGAYTNLSGQSQPLSPVEVGYAHDDAAILSTQNGIEIDYKRHQSGFFVSSPSAPPAGAVTLPLGMFLGEFTMPVSVAGRKPILVELDTGNDGTFHLFPTKSPPTGSKSS